MKDILEIGWLGAITLLLLRQQSSPLLPPKKRSRRLVLDSCALIDGRILDVAKAGFVAEQLIIPEFVLRELQLLADGSDAHKRERARFGLDVARQLQIEATIQVIVDHTTYEHAAIDDQLVRLAKKLHAQLYTTDFNLNKVAAVEGVVVLNINELAQSLRPMVLPGERITIKILQKGNNRGQGVGYLDDGTMVVVDNAERSIGKTVTATVQRMHQTVAGKMVFASMAKPPKK